ncbi:hypothetical protein [Streptomyces sp. ITFR-16]|uniref:hypothetical protein n=1 Tax=Streptomyces sp. ITFR-16 TaxID=3075198 RepID=UPI00288B5AD1|nr:hypothetical protein [Streptomyces sp. ITFR-16]WNI26954.1 hypothetical protein RLT58_18850 [Streptomyces sp. ITFR-16]
MPLVAVAAVVPLYAVWAALLATGGGDLAAQQAWSGFTARHPGSAYNLSWYGGMHTANYSVFSSYLMALLGVRTVSVVAGIAATWLMARLLVRTGTRHALVASLLAAFALWCNVASGRTTFALGVAIALVACVYAHRAVTAVVAGALATMASPVAGLFLVVVGAARLLDRQWRRGAVLMAPFFAVVGATTVLFPFQGEQPMHANRLWMPLVVCAALAAAAPRGREWRVPRHGAVVYAVGVVLTFLVASPIGTNVERLLGLVALPVLFVAVMDVVREKAWVRTVVLAAALALSAQWLVDKTVDDLRVSTEVPSWASGTEGVVGELRRLGAERTRVEVVPARNHREAAVLSPYVSLARGWNRQLDVERGRLFYAHGDGGALSPADYRAWLDHWAVGFVVLPHGRPDGPAESEAALVRAGRPWLERVWQDDGWTVYRVREATPLVPAPASVVGGDDAELVVRMPHAGSVTVRVAYSPWLRVQAVGDGGGSGGACLRQNGEWTELTVRKGGTYRLHSAYGLARFTGGC